MEKEDDEYDNYSETDGSRARTPMPSLASQPNRLTERSLLVHNSSLTDSMSTGEAFSIINPESTPPYSFLESIRRIQQPSRVEHQPMHSDTDQKRSSNGTANQGFWHRFTRRVIHDIMGFDDEVLDVLFGERFIDSDSVPETLSPMANTAAAATFSLQSEKSSSLLSSTNSKKYWEDRLIARIGRELTVRYCRDYGSLEICNGLFI